ncbi:MAG: type III secretion system chaperone [Verrucomicrobia bacterium]|nr:type III secretion system chaperone [Verrucomicrobiota bacterium]
MAVTLEDLIGKLRKKVKNDALRVDEFGEVNFVADSRLNVRIQEFPEIGELLFSAALGTVQFDRSTEEVYRTLLQANYRWVLTAGGSLALELGPEPEVILDLREPLVTLDSERFEARLEDFIDCAGYWADYLAAPSPDTTEPPQSTETATDFVRV